MDELDGRDEMVRKHYKNRKDMVVQTQAADAVIAAYTAASPWEPAFYSRFDDLPPIREAEFQSYIKGEPGCRKWKLPVTEVEHHGAAAAWYDQMEVGTVEITEVPTSDGESEYWIKLKN